MTPVIYSDWDLEKFNPKAWVAEHGVIVIRGERYAPGALFDIASKLGPVQNNPYGHGVPHFPWVYPISNRGKGYTNEAVRYWHFDGSLRQERCRYSLLYAIHAGLKGELLLASASMKNVSPKLREQIMLSEKFTTSTGITRNFIQPHPRTKEPVLQVNVGKSVSVPGVLLQISDWLDAHSDPFTFQDNDLLILDNFSVLHKATAPDDSVERLLYRITTAHQEP